MQLKSLLHRMLKEFGSRRRLAKQLGVTERTLFRWLQLGEKQLRSLRHDNLRSILSTARDVGINIRSHEDAFARSMPAGDHRLPGRQEPSARSRNKVSSGIKLSNLLKGPGAWVAQVTFSPDGTKLAIASQAGMVQIWDIPSGQIYQSMRVPTYHIYSATWSPDAMTLATCHEDEFIRIWNIPTGTLLSQIKLEALPNDLVEVSKKRKSPKQSTGNLRSEDRAQALAWSPDGRFLASGGEIGLCIWKAGSTERLNVFREAGKVISLAWSPDGKHVATTSYDDAICIFDIATETLRHRFAGTYSAALAWSPDGQLIASVIESTIYLWDIKSGLPVKVLEGHTARPRSICFSSDGRLMASKSGSGIGSERASDHRILIWRTDTWEICGVINDRFEWYLYTGLSFSPTEPLLAASVVGDEFVATWQIDLDRLLSTPQPTKSIYYKNAKAVLVGDSGVGKSGLALVLSGHRFKATESTHARRIHRLKTCRVDLGRGRGEIRELILWDLAGQPGYRLVHQLHLEDVSVGIIVFDSRSELDPFAGVRYWNRVLLHATGTRFNNMTPATRLLAAARIDRGTIAVGKERIVSVIRELGIASYTPTSAKEGEGVSELCERIETSIDWENIPSVTSNEFFLKIKRFLIKEGRSGRILATVDDLVRGFLRVTKRHFSTRLQANFSTCIQRLQSLGLIRRFSFGDLILLQPEIVDAYASSIIFAAKQEPDGMGSILEDDIRNANFLIPKEHRIENKEVEKLLLLATIEDLLFHEIAFREPSEQGQLLVFPSQLTRENPELPNPSGKEVIYEFEGPTLNIYATLIVRLARSNIFVMKDIWKNAVTFVSKDNGNCGLYLTEIEEGRGSIGLFYTPETSALLRYQFDDYIHTHLARRALPDSIRRQQLLVCPNQTCRNPINKQVLEKRMERGFDWIMCSICDTRIEINVSSALSSTATPPITADIDKAAAQHRLFDTALVSASAEMQTSGFRKWAGSERTTLVLVFTDVVGSTILGDELGDEKMREVRRKHFAQARKLIGRHSGYEIKTIGDSFMVAFRTAVEGLNFSLEFRGDTGDSQVHIRAGIHVGPVHIEEDDAFGNMVNYAARVIGQAKGAEIWISDRTHSDIQSEKAKTHQLLIWEKHPNCLLKGFNGMQILWSLKDG